MSSKTDKGDRKNLDDFSYEEIRDMSPNKLVEVSPVRHHPSKAPTEDDATESDER
ncbi:hypothetical protein EGH25_10465 [Haladaptatus sp. F3-133]|uniref:Uncharacterized protein n=1 Tax=Halorutilus salinus TaxID=2487751 RepID=A0A9Q4GK23_9EURY|nr:hypothetical protein [Halorutilus salinus]MCX2819771.1 hypothetical protein [Halorutilus salinus]